MILPTDIIIQMDFLIDERFFKNNKRAGLIILGLASLLTFAYTYSRRTDSDEEDEEKDNPQQRRPAGIMNLGNTCFVNSLLQALASLKVLINDIDDLLEEETVSRMSIDSRLLWELRAALIKINENSSGESINISNFLGVLSSFSNLINLEQQDAHELYSTIVASYERVCNQRKSPSLTGSINLKHKSEITDDLEQWQHPRIDNSLVGYTKSSIRCVTCGVEENIKIHPFYDLSLEIAPRKINTLVEALDHLQAKEIINGWVCTKCSINGHRETLSLRCQSLWEGIPTADNKSLADLGDRISSYCLSLLKEEDLDVSDANERLEDFVFQFMREFEELEGHPKRGDIFCKIEPVKRTIIKQTVISKYPKILVIHLKQLSMDPYTGNPVLLRKPIQFSQILPVRTRMGIKSYQLTSLLSHVGNEAMGHYYAFRRLSGSEKQWFVISDTSSRECRWEYLSMCIPYMLFYELEGNRE